MCKVELISHTPDPEKIVAAAAKLCYSAKSIDGLLEGLHPENTRQFVEMLMEIGHESPVEHVSFTFGIEGVSRTFLAQMTRHRIASYSVQSQRYVSMADFAYVTPPEIAADPEALELYHRAMDDAAASYDKLSEILTKSHTQRLVAEGVEPAEAAKKAKKLAIEDARFVLPGGCDTKMLVTMNTRSLYNFFEHRCCTRAQWEIRQVADLMLAEVSKVAPLLFAHCGPPCVNGPCPEGKMSCGKAPEIRKKYRKEV